MRLISPHLYLLVFVSAGLSMPAFAQQDRLPTEWAQVDPAPGSTSYQEINLSFQHEGLTLKGRLVLPKTPGQHPVVVLMGGSDSWSFYKDYFRALVDTFVPAGVGVFYYDKRNEGTDLAEKSSFDVLAGDVLAAVEMLRKRDDVDPKALGLWGHSQGGWIAPLAASRSDHVRFVITAGGPGVGPFEQTMYSQANAERRRGLSEDEVDAADALRRKLAQYYAHPTDQGRQEAQAALDAARRTPWFQKARFQELQGVGDSLASPARLAQLNNDHPEVLQLYTEQMPYDPVPALRSIGVPLLAIYGGADQVVPVDRSVAAFRAAFEASGHRHLLTIHVFPGANHGIMMGGDGLNFAPGYLDTMREWLVSVTHGTRAPDRAQRWQDDLAAMVAGIERLHVSPFIHVSRRAWEGHVSTLRGEIPELSDDQVIVGLMKLAALIGDGHTVVVPPFEGPLQFHRYGVSFYVFQDGLFVRQAADPYADLVGTRVVRLGGVPADSLMDLVAEVYPHDNGFGLRWGMELVLPIAEVLHGLGIAASADQVSIEVEDGAGTRRATTLRHPEPLTGDMLQESVFSGDHPGWHDMLRAGATAPTWRRDLDTPYRYEYLADSHVIHLMFNQVRDGDTPFPDFVSELFRFTDSHDVSAILLDLRNNEGGDLTMATPLITGLIRHDFDAKGRLYVATGHRTFSAAGYLAARLSAYTKATFVGEPPATSPNFIGEASDPFQLPHSRLWVNASTLAWQGTFAFDHRPYIEPDLRVGLTSDDYREGRDPVLKKVLDLVAAGGSAAEPRKATAPPFRATVGGNGVDVGNKIVALPDGGYAVVGYTSSRGAGGEDVILIRTDANGKTLWTRTYGGKGDDDGWDLLPRRDGGFVISGFGNSWGAGGDDIIMLGTDADGRLQWRKTFGGTQGERSWGMGAMPDGGYVVVGQTRSWGAGDWDAYVVRTDARGDSLWTRTFGGPGVDRALNAVVTPSGNIAVTGFETSAPGADEDAFVALLSPAGKILWRRTMSGPGNEVGHGIVWAGDGRLLVTGYGNSWGSGGNDVDLWSVEEADGTIRWRKEFGSFDMDDRAMMTSVEPDGSLMIVGYVHGPEGDWDASLWHSTSDGRLLDHRVLLHAGDDRGVFGLAEAGGSVVLTGAWAAEAGAPPDIVLTRINPVGRGS